MAKYTVTAGCGHTVEQQLYGPGKERERRLAWMRSEHGKCNPCYAALKRAEELARAEEQVRQLAATVRAHYAGEGIEIPVEDLRRQIAEHPEHPQAVRMAAALELLGI